MFPPNAPNLIKVIRTLWQPWWIYVVSFVAVVILTPLLRSLAIRWKCYDRPEGLLKHAKPTPYLGGLAIFIAWVIPLLIWAFTSSPQYLQEIMAIVLGGALLLTLGLVDDLKTVRSSYKIIAQIAVAVSLYIAGVRFEAIPQISVQGMTLFAPGSLGFIAIGLLIQILLIVGTSNAIKLFDGLDGLCSGVTVVIAVGFLLVATHIGAWAVPAWCADLTGASYPFNEFVVVLALALTAAGLGFLLYNFNPATIFLGEAGGTFLGYLAAVFMILFADKPGMIKWFLAGLMIMGLPIFDTALTLVRRIRNKTPLFGRDNNHFYTGLTLARRIRDGQPTFGGDRSHFHDQLIDRGVSVRRTVMISYALAILTVAIAVGTLAMRTRYMVPLYFLILLAAAVLAVLGGFVKVESSSEQTTRKAMASQNDRRGTDSAPEPIAPTKKLLIMGAGGLGREMANAVTEINSICPTFEVLGFLDDEQKMLGQKLLGLSVLGSTEQLAEYKSSELQAVLAVGDGYVREKLARVAKEYDIPLATIIHPSSIIAAQSPIQDGVFIAAGCVITINVHLGHGVLVNMGCTIAHDVRIGEFCSINPGARISGQVVIKDHSLIGSQAVILNKCTIGQGAAVAMGAVVAQDVPDYTLVAGNPARVVKRLEKPK